MKYTEVYSPKKPRSLQLRGSSRHDSVEEKEWYKNRDNFIDVEIPYYTNQEYQYLNRGE